MTDSGENRVDLGLLGLLDDDKGKSPQTPALTDAATPTLTNVTPADTESHLQSLWNSRELLKLIETVESAIDDPSKTGIISRLWWGRAQVAKGDLPISFLSAPLETALTQALDSKSDPEITQLAKLAAQELVAKLSTAENKDECATLLSLCDKLGFSYKATETTKEDAQPIIPEKVPAWAMGVKAKNQMPVTRIEKGKGKSFNSEVQGGSGKRALLFVAALLLMLLIGGYFLISGLDLKLFAAKDAVVAPEKVALQVPSDPAMRAPEPTKLQKVGSLGAIFYDMASATAVPKPTLEASQNQNQNKPVDVQPEAKLPKTKAQVNTDGPIEAPQFGEKLTKPERSPELNGQQKQPIEGFPVDKLPESKTYQVLAKTPVLSEPTEYGRVLGQLSPGDKVLVEAKVGTWLRLRSKKGRGGFVRAENIAEITVEDAQDPFRPVLPPPGR